jgi:hypothetical protein
MTALKPVRDLEINAILRSEIGCYCTPLFRQRSQKLTDDAVHDSGLQPQVSCIKYQPSEKPHRTFRINWTWLRPFRIIPISHESSFIQSILSR